VEFTRQGEYVSTLEGLITVILVMVGLMLLAMVPPLWKSVMNPRVEAYYQGELDQLFREGPRINNIA